MRVRGSLAIGTTHTQARYVLPEVIQQFRASYPDVRLNLHQGTSEQIAEMVAQDRIDCAINTGSEHLFNDLTLLPCYRWHRVIVVPRNHPLAEVAKPTLKQLVAYPLITYTFSFSGPSSLHQAFTKAGLTPDVAITARDSDVIKTYVRLGLGVGLVAQMAVNAHEDADLVFMDASHLFSSHVTGSVFGAACCCASTCMTSRAPAGAHLDRRVVDRAHRMTTGAEVAQLFERHGAATVAVALADPPRNGASDLLKIQQVLGRVDINGRALRWHPDKPVAAALQQCAGARIRPPQRAERGEVFAGKMAGTPAVPA